LESRQSPLIVGGSLVGDSRSFVGESGLRVGDYCTGGILNEDTDRTRVAAVEGLEFLRSGGLACGIARFLEEG